MATKEIFGFISLILVVVGYVPYVWTIFRKQTKPHVFSWVIWGTVSAIVYCAQYSVHAGPGAWASGLTALGCFLIAALALPYGEKKITFSDWLSFCGALIAIPIWIATHDPTGSVILVTLIDVTAYYPTFRKSYFKPYEENIVMYIATVLKYGCALAALENHSLAAVLAPVFIIVVETSFVVMVLYKRRNLSKTI